MSNKYVFIKNLPSIIIKSSNNEHVLLNKNKIVNIEARKSYLYLKNKYILDIMYYNPHTWTSFTYINSTMSIPVINEEKYVYYKLKYLDYFSIQTCISELKNININKICNKI